jgi:hypothetical protein
VKQISVVQLQVLDERDILLNLNIISASANLLTTCIPVNVQQQQQPPPRTMSVSSHTAHLDEQLINNKINSSYRFVVKRLAETYSLETRCVSMKWNS